MLIKNWKNLIFVNALKYRVIRLYVEALSEWFFTQNIPSLMEKASDFHANSVDCKMEKTWFLWCFYGYV